VCYGLRFANLQEFPPLSPAYYKDVLLIGWAFGRSVPAFAQRKFRLRPPPSVARLRRDPAEALTKAGLAHQAVDSSMPKKFNKPLHNTLRPVSHNLILLSQAVTPMVQPERLSKILIPYGDTERTDKLGIRIPVARLDGHQNFSRINWYA